MPGINAKKALAAGAISQTDLQRLGEFLLANHENLKGNIDFAQSAAFVGMSMGGTRNWWHSTLKKVNIPEYHGVDEGESNISSAPVTPRAKPKPRKRKASETPTESPLATPSAFKKNKKDASAKKTKMEDMKVKVEEQDDDLEGDKPEI